LYLIKIKICLFTCFVQDFNCLCFIQFYTYNHQDLIKQTKFHVLLLIDQNQLCLFTYLTRSFLTSSFCTLYILSCIRYIPSNVALGCLLYFLTDLLNIINPLLYCVDAASLHINRISSYKRFNC